MVIATGTLAFGINMPCRTVVFLGDHIFLSALQFRQMMGRAGRRGFDPLGHVVFFGVGPRKVRSLMVSERVGVGATASRGVGAGSISHSDDFGLQATGHESSSMSMTPAGLAGCLEARQNPPPLPVCEPTTDAAHL